MVRTVPSLLRGGTYGTVNPLSVLQREAGFSRNWVRTLADSLADQGFLEKRFIRRVGPGRPQAAYLITGAGQKMLEAFVDAEARLFGSGVSVAGPLWSLARYGFPFMGPRDAFVNPDHRGRFSALVEVEAPPYVLAHPTQEGATLFPSPDDLVVWLVSSGDERRVLAAPFLARDHVSDWGRLWDTAKAHGAQGRLAYVLAATGQENRIPADVTAQDGDERLLALGGQDHPLAQSFHVSSVVPPERFRDFASLYRGG